MEVIHCPHRGTQREWERLNIDRERAVHQILPLEVGVELGREPGKCRMSGINEQPHRFGNLAMFHARVPEGSAERAGHRIRKCPRTRRKNNTSTLLQRRFDRRIPARGERYPFGNVRLILLRVDPEVVAIHPSIGCTDHQPQGGGLFHAVERYLNLTRRRKPTHRRFHVFDATGSNRFARFFLKEPFDFPTKIGGAVVG